jgi:hypothetical protein
MTKSRGIITRRRWTPEELQVLRLHYPDGSTNAIAAFLDRRIFTVYQMAGKLGLSKTEAFHANAHLSGRFDNLSRGGEPFRFQKGQAPPNKGLRRPGWAPGRMATTQFKKGRRKQEDPKYIPIGGFRVNADGYLDRKVCDDCIPQHRFMGYHRYVWMMANGPIPPGHIVRFKPERKTTWAFTITPDALECITLRENRLRNSIHQVMSPELREITYLRAQIKRTINRRLKDGKEHDRGAPRAPVRHTHRAARQGKANGHRSGARSG